MKSLSLKLLVAALAGSALFATTLPAQARHDHRDWRDGYRDSRHYSPPPGHAYGDNMGATRGRLPDAETRNRMAALIDSA